MTLEILNGSLVFLSSLSAGERAEILALTGFGIFLL
jgi:hypothetical protein